MIRNASSGSATEVGCTVGPGGRPEAGWTLREAPSPSLLRPVLQRFLLEPRTVLIGQTQGGLPWGFRLDEGAPAHLSITGPSGCGKSELLRSCLVSLCWSTSPGALGVLGIDPGGQQLGMIDCLPHAILEPVVERRRARALLAWLADEVRQRQLTAEQGMRLVVAVEDLGSWEGTDSLVPGLAWLRRWGGDVGIHILQVARSGNETGSPLERSTWHACGHSEPGHFEVGDKDGVHPIQALWLPVRDLVACLDEIRQSAWLAGADGSMAGGVLR